MTLTTFLEEESLEKLIDKAGYDLREITFHTDGRVIAKSGAMAKNPKKLYGERPKEGDTRGTLTKKAVIKLIKDLSSHEN